MTNVDLKAAFAQTIKEIEDEKFRQAVDARKIQLQSYKWWHKFFLGLSR